MEPITFSDTFSGPRYTGQMGASALFSPLASIVNILVRNSMAPVRIESIDCNVQIEPGRKIAQIESVRLLSDTIEPGQTLKAFVTLKPFKGERETVEVALPIPSDFPEGVHEAVFCDMGNSIRRRFRNDPTLLEPRDLEASSMRFGSRPSPSGPRSTFTSPRRNAGCRCRGRLYRTCRAACGPSSLPSARYRSHRSGPIWSRRFRPAGSWKAVQSLKFTVAKDAGLSLSLHH